MKKEQERIGKRKRYKGKFQLIRSSNPFKFIEKTDYKKRVVDEIIGQPLWIFGKIPKYVKLNCVATYIGNGLFTADGMNVFKEKK